MDVQKQRRITMARHYHTSVREIAKAERHWRRTGEITETPDGAIQLNTDPKPPRLPHVPRGKPKKGPTR